MNTIKQLLVAITLLLSITNANAQIKNKTTEKIRINGNCSMCKKTIETAANVNKVAQLTWNESTQIATLIYDKSKTSSDAVLKRVAQAGYDNEKHIASDAVYDNLHGCCQYDRSIKAEKKVKNKDKSQF